MKRIALACALMACGEQRSIEQRATLAPEVGAQGVAGATGPAGEVGPAGADGAPGAGWLVVDADGVVLAPLVNVTLSGTRPVFMWYADGLFWEADAATASPMRSTGIFYESASCNGAAFMPSAGGVSDADDVAFLVLDYFGPKAHAVIRRDGDEVPALAMRGYAGAYPDGSRWCLALPEEQGSTSGVPIRLEPAPRWTGPLHLAPR